MTEEKIAIRTVQTLLDGLIDYAGLFPPARLDMASAVAEYQRQRNRPHAWALARFIVPVARLDAFEDARRRLHGPSDEPWPLSVLPGTDLDTARQRLDTLAGEAPEIARAEAAELKASSPEEIEYAVEVLDGLDLYFELAIDESLDDLLAVVAEHGAAAKIRTGAVTEDGIPTPAEVIRFLLACQRAGVPFKATAGLHHPLRGDYPLTYEAASPRGTMHGFLNVFLTAAFLDAERIGEAEAEALLTESSPEAFEWSEGGVAWHGLELEAEELARARRHFARSYGSCSFAEPIDELRDLKWLE